MSLRSVAVFVGVFVVVALVCAATDISAQATVTLCGLAGIVSAVAAESLLAKQDGED